MDGDAGKGKLRATGNVLTGLLLTTGLILGVCSIHAQNLTTSSQNNVASLSSANVSWSSVSDLQVMLQAVESTPPLPPWQLPIDGCGYYSAQHPDYPPFPRNVLQLNGWPLGNGLVLLDDRGIDYQSLAQSQNAGVVQPMDGSGDPLPANTNFTIALQGSNISLKWTSVSNRIYLLEQRPTLSSATEWSGLTNYYLSAANSNSTTFVHSNIVQLQPVNFYRLFDVTPTARPDFFAAGQNSSANALDVLQNDYSPNDDLFYVASATQPLHGSITATISNVVYTPTSGFYGTDSFSYRITSGYGDISSNATVTVFVNKSGNTPPAVNNLIFTLQTNVYSVTFNALTNATGNSPVLYAVTPPSMGSVSNDASGNITYIRNPNLFGNDAFTYILTDVNGGYTVGNVRVQQQDTSGDGLSDQWDLRYGFNPTVDNSLGDPANDGLPNLAKFVLGLDPTKAENVLNLPGVPNGTQISGFAQLPIYGLSSAIPTPPLILYVNGLPAENSVLTQGPDGTWLMNWDTTFLTNGNYQIQLECSVAPTSSPDSITDVLGATITVQVNNPITFDKLTHQFTSFLYIYGTLANSNDTYDVYLYDDYGNPLVYATGLSAPNGQIALGWDLTDGQGHQISFGNIQEIFYLHPPTGSGSVQPADTSFPPPVHHWSLKQIASSGGPFAVAWGWDQAPSYYSPELDWRTEYIMHYGVIDIIGNPAANNEYFLLPLDNYPFGGTCFRYDSDTDKVRLNQALAVSGNFFWFGHGSPAAIMGNEDHSLLASFDVGDLLKNHSHESTPKKPLDDGSPYKLVILNGCETYSQAWANAFGIDFYANGSSVPVSFYNYAYLMPQAFVGWTKKIGVPSAYQDLAAGGLIDAEYGEALGNLFADWMSGYPICNCMQDFSDTALGEDPFHFVNADSWRISGCYDLTRGD